MKKTILLFLSVFLVSHFSSGQNLDKEHTPYNVADCIRDLVMANVQRSSNVRLSDDASILTLLDGSPIPIDSLRKIDAESIASIKLNLNPEPKDFAMYGSVMKFGWLEIETKKKEK